MTATVAPRQDAWYNRPYMLPRLSSERSSRSSNGVSTGMFVRPARTGAWPDPAGSHLAARQTAADREQGTHSCAGAAVLAGTTGMWQERRAAGHATVTSTEEGGN